MTNSVQRFREEMSSSTQVSYGGLQMGRVDKLYLTSIAQDPVAAGLLADKLSTLDLSCYNLFVLDEEAITMERLAIPNQFVVPKNEVLTEGTSREIIAAFTGLKPEAIGKIKNFPALVAAKNSDYKKAGSSQTAVLGVVTNMKIQETGVKVCFYGSAIIPQQQVNKLADELGLEQTDYINELDRSHWAIKRIDLANVLKNIGINPFYTSK
jgi:hypothetical protein